jgi:hypothetical protein
VQPPCEWNESAALSCDLAIVQVHHPFTVNGSAAARAFRPWTTVQSDFAAALAGDEARPLLNSQQALAAASAVAAAKARALRAEEARAYEEIRYAFPALPALAPALLFEPLLGPVALPGAAPESSSAGDTSSASGLWATDTFDGTVASDSRAGASATGLTEYSTALLFPRPGELCTFEVRSIGRTFSRRGALPLLCCLASCETIGGSATSFGFDFFEVPRVCCQGGVPA